MSAAHRRTPHVAILGIRGLPAAHGGFESFAERLAPHLVEQGWHVTVYCQEDGQGPRRRSHWQGVQRVHIHVGDDTPVASMRFDWHAITETVRDRPDVALVLGYNTAAFTARLRLAGIPTLINMDGIEWSRAKWGPAAKAWLYLNERMGCWLGHHLVADHPHIARHLATRVSPRKIATIPYGGELIERADVRHLERLGLAPGEYLTLIARPEPENSVLEVVQAYSARPRPHPLVVLGHYAPDASPFHRAVLQAASPDVRFVGAIYDAAVVQALRRNCRLYVHGHRVGGTNPSLLEAMGAGNAVLAHDNPFNRWVAGAGAVYFRDRAGCERLFDQMAQIDWAAMGRANQARVREVFDWQQVLGSYTDTLQAMARRERAPAAERVGHPDWRRHTVS